MHHCGCQRPIHFPRRTERPFDFRGSIGQRWCCGSGRPQGCSRLLKNCCRSRCSLVRRRGCKAPRQWFDNLQRGQRIRWPQFDILHCVQHLKLRRYPRPQRVRWWRLPRCSCSQRDCTTLKLRFGNPLRGLRCSRRRSDNLPHGCNCSPQLSNSLRSVRQALPRKIQSPVHGLPLRSRLILHQWRSNKQRSPCCFGWRQSCRRLRQLCFFPAPANTFQLHLCQTLAPTIV